MKKGSSKKFGEEFRIRKDEEQIKPTNVLSVSSQNKEKDERQKLSNEDSIKKKNKTLIILFIVLGVVIILWGVGYFWVQSMNHFEYEEVKFDVVKEGDLIFYNTKVQIFSEEGNIHKYIGDYNFYLRKDPRKIAKEVPFKGKLYLLKSIVINSTEDFNCNGDGIIAVANIINLFNVMGAKVIKDDNATCDSQGKYVFIRLKPGNMTEVRLVGPACYDLSINNCEILDVTERFMLETFIEIEKY